MEFGDIFPIKSGKEHLLERGHLLEQIQYINDVCVLWSLNTRVRVNLIWSRSFYSGILYLTPIVCKVSIELYSKTQLFLKDSIFTPIFKIKERTLKQQDSNNSNQASANSGSALIWISNLVYNICKIHVYGTFLF